MTIGELAKLCDICPRTIRDWRREKFTISEDSCRFLSEKFEIEIPKTFILIDKYWYVFKGAKSGGLRCLELYGPPGTRGGRILGGLMSQKKRRENPEKYRLLGCNVPKDFSVLKPSGLLAEMVGIILGDGGITDYQLKITLDSKTDLEYAKHVTKISKNLFGYEFSISKRKDCQAIDLYLSGVNLIAMLNKWGLKKGNKIKMQVDFPGWIWDKSSYQKMCVRGLMDTDGCVFSHDHEIKGVRYRNLGVCFTSLSKPLLHSFSKVLALNSIKHSFYEQKNRVYIYNFNEIKKYFKIIGSSNSKHKNMFNYHLLYNRESGFRD